MSLQPTEHCNPFCLCSDLFWWLWANDFNAHIHLSLLRNAYLLSSLNHIPVKAMPLNVHAQYISISLHSHKTSWNSLPLLKNTHWLYVVLLSLQLCMYIPSCLLECIYPVSILLVSAYPVGLTRFSESAYPVDLWEYIHTQWSICPFGWCIPMVLLVSAYFPSCPLWAPSLAISPSNSDRISSLEIEGRGFPVGTHFHSYVSTWWYAWILCHVHITLS